MCVSEIVVSEHQRSARKTLQNYSFHTVRNNVSSEELKGDWHERNPNKRNKNATTGHGITWPLALRPCFHTPTHPNAPPQHTAHLVALVLRQNQRCPPLCGATPASGAKRTQTRAEVLSADSTLTETGTTSRSAEGVQPRTKICPHSQPPSKSRN